MFEIAGGGILLMTKALHSTEPFIITLPSSQYDLNIVERDIKYQIIIITLSGNVSVSMLFLYTVSALS